MTDAGDEEVLAGGNLNRVVRIGSTVRRPAGPWTPTVHALLRHVRAAGYPAPEPLGIDEQGREVLSFVAGNAVGPTVLDLDGVRRAAGLITDLHTAQAGFVVPTGATWNDLARDPSGSEEVIAHDDLAPWNLIAGPTWTYIDWDLAAPGRRHWDLAWALHSFAGLWEDVVAPVPRIEAFCAGAHVPPAERPALLGTVVERIDHMVTKMRRLATAGDTVQQRLVDGGHDTLWDAGARHVEANLEEWTAQLER